MDRTKRTGPGDGGDAGRENRFLACLGRPKSEGDIDRIEPGDDGDLDRED
jgi:hypothetical protein